MGMVSSCKQTPNMDPPKRLSIAHWKALGESYLLSHKSSSGGGSMKELWPLKENKYKWVNIAFNDRCTCKRHNIECTPACGNCRGHLVAQMFFMTMMTLTCMYVASQTTVTIEMSFIQLTAVFVSSRVANAGA